VTNFIVGVESDRAKEIQWEYDHNTIWIGGWGEGKPPVESLNRVTKTLIDRVTDRIMDIVTEGGHGETQLMALKPEVRKAIHDLLFTPQES
jgi:hypothetical protein